MNRILIHKYGGKAVLATFDTVSGEGMRVKHYICLNDCGNAYFDVTHRLVNKDNFEPCDEILTWVSERIFFGKYRYMETMAFYKPETWRLIATAVEKLEELK